MKLLRRKGTAIATIALGFAAAAASLSSPLIAARPAHALDKVIYQYAWIPDGLFTPDSTGAAKGFYEEEGIDLTMRAGRGTSDAVKKVAAGAATFGDGDISDVMRARVNENIPVRCIAHIHNHSPHALFALKSSGIKGSRTSRKTLGDTGNSTGLLSHRCAPDQSRSGRNQLGRCWAGDNGIAARRQEGGRCSLPTGTAPWAQVKLIGDELLIFLHDRL